MNEMETLDLKWQDMVAIACLEAKGDVDRLAQAIRNGLDSGLTPSTKSRRHCRNFMPIPVFRVA